MSILGSGFEATDGVGAQFNRFLSNIELTATQRTAASTRHYSIRDKLQSEFPGSKTLVVGSYNKNTAIRPPSDLDILLVLPEVIYDKYNSFDFIFKNGQSIFLQEIKRRVQKYYPLTNIRADGQVISVEFSGSFSVEIVPCFEVGIFSKKYRIADTNNGGNWKDVDPIGESDNLSSSNKSTNGNTIRLIKMLKCWKLNCNVLLKSFHIELLASNFLLSYEHRLKTSTHYDWMVRDFFKWLSESYSSWGNYISHPTTYESFNLGDDWKSKVDSAYQRAFKAIEYTKRNDLYSAKSEWQKIFGNNFIG